MEMLRVFWDAAVALNPAAAARDEQQMPLCRQGELGVLWREHRLQDVSEKALTIPMRFSTFDDYWSPFLDRQGPAGAYVASLCGKRARAAAHAVASAAPRRGRGPSNRALGSCVGRAGYRPGTPCRLSCVRQAPIAMPGRRLAWLPGNGSRRSVAAVQPASSEESHARPNGQ